MNTKSSLILDMIFTLTWSLLSGQAGLLTEEELSKAATLLEQQRDLPVTALEQQEPDITALNRLFSVYTSTLGNPEEKSNNVERAQTLRTYLDDLGPSVIAAQEAPLTENELVHARLMAEKFNVPLGAPASVEQALKKLQQQVTIYETALDTIPLTKDETQLPTLMQNLKEHAQEIRRYLEVLDPYTR